MSAPPRWLLDANVLFPSVLREILMGVAARGGFVPLWSERILAEWQLAAAKRDAETAQTAAQAIAALRAAWPDAEVPTTETGAGTHPLPDPADTHVLAAAIAGHADAILTQNLRDFPARALAPVGLTARAPDDALMELWLAAPAPIEASVAETVRRTEALSGRAQPVRALLRRARLPRLGKALG